LELVERFEEAWRQGKRPVLENYLPAGEARDSEALQLLVRVDLEYRRRAGETACLEDYLARYPELSGDCATYSTLSVGRTPPPRDQPASPPAAGQPLSPEHAPTLSQDADPSPGQARGEAGSSGAAPPTLGVDDSPPAPAQTPEASAEAHGTGRLPSIPGYELHGVLGRGGMGVVYKARNPRLKRFEALKMIITGDQARPDELERFHREAEAVARLQHPNIVQVYEVGQHQGLPYLCLELVEGTNLARKLKHMPHPAAFAAETIETLARAIHAAHERGIVHRDLKPSNVLVAADGTLKVTDFGLAKRLDLDTAHTPTGAVLGTPPYMAPEQVQGARQEISPATDVYALGAILYEILTGHPPFQAESPYESMLQVLSQEPVPPSRLQPKVPRDLETICLKCLAKAPARRYASALALAEDLHCFQMQEPIRARPVGMVERAWKAARRRPAMTAVLVLSLASVLGGAGYAYAFLVWHNRDLQEQLDKARREVNTFRDEQQQSEQDRRLGELRKEVDASRDRAQDALKRQDWAGARVHFADALARIGQDAAGEQLAGMAGQIRAQAGQLQDARDRFVRFGTLHNEALFWETLLIGLQPVAHGQEAKAAAVQALGLFGVNPAAVTPPVLPAAYLSAAEQQQIREGCYELLLLCAETASEGQRGEDQARRASEALHLLDGLANLGGPATRASFLRRARYLAQRGDPAAAQKAREQADRCTPSGIFDQYLCAYEWYKKGDLERALRELEHTLRQHPEHIWARHFLAVCYLKSARYSLAAVNLSVCLVQERSFWGYLLQGLAHAELRDFDAADADYREALSRARNDLERYAVLVNHGALRLRQARAGQSIAALRHVALLSSQLALCRCFAELAYRQHMRQALADLDAAVRLRPNLYHAYVNRAVLCEEQGQPAEALRQLDQALRCEPGDPRLYSSLALLHERQANLPAALADCEQAIRLRSREGPTLALAQDQAERARILYLLARYPEAANACDQALALWADYPQAHYLRGQALYKAENYLEAAAAFDRYLQVGRPSAEIYRARGVARAKLRQHQAAVDDYTRALELAPDAASYAQRGWLYLLVFDSPRLAYLDFDEAIKRDPTKAELYSGRGSAQALLGDPERGIKDAELALRLGPKTAHLLYIAARTYSQAAGIALVNGRATDWSRKASWDGYATRATELIRQALALAPPGGPEHFWNEYIQRDVALDPIRKHPNFLLLYEGLPRRAAQQPAASP
jgi:tetratricopeptide (TPR) repeat protein